MIKVKYNKYKKEIGNFFINIALIPEEEGYEMMEDTNLNTLNIIIDNYNSDLDKNNSLTKNLPKKFGFQSDNPRKDLSSGGVYSLEFIIYFVYNCKIESKNILSNKYLLFTVEYINLCYKLCLILHLTG